MEPLNTYTLKIQLEGELRRISVTKATTLAQVHSSLRQLFQEQLPSSSLPILTWLDEDGDVISLKTQRDLEECLAFMASSGLSSLKIQLEAGKNPEPAPPSATAPPSAHLSAPSGDDNDATPSFTPSSAPAPAPLAPQSSEPEPLIPTSTLKSSIPSSPRAVADQRGAPTEEPREKPSEPEQPFRRHGNHHQYQGRHFQEPRGKFQEPRGKKEPWHLRNAERLATKLEGKMEHFSKRLEKKRSSPFFDASEHARQVQVLKESGVAVSPLIELLIAKSIIRAKKDERGLARKQKFKRGFLKEDDPSEIHPPHSCPPPPPPPSHHHRRHQCGPKPFGKQYARFSEETRRQLEGLRIEGLPVHPVMGIYLEINNRPKPSGL